MTPTLFIEGPAFWAATLPGWHIARAVFRGDARGPFRKDGITQIGLSFEQQRGIGGSRNETLLRATKFADLAPESGVCVHL